MKKNYRQVTQKNLAEFRQLIHKQQKGICPILKQKIPFTDTVVDHKHGSKTTDTGYKGKGLIRGVIQTQANAIEGKIHNAYIRYGLKKFIELPVLLRRIADYIENPPLGYKYIHPSEIQKPKKIKKRCFKKVVVAHKEKYPNRKFPVAFKKEILTSKLKELFTEFNIDIEYRK